MRPALFLVLTCFVLLFPSMGQSQTPAVVQHVDVNFAETNTQAPRNGTFYIVGRTVQLPNATRAGNCIVVAVIAKSTVSTLPTVTDDIGNTYTQITHQRDSANSTDMTVFVALNITDGARIIAAAWPSGRDTGCTAIKVTEFNNVTAVDASNTAQTNSATITGGSVTPAFTNDLLYMVGWQDASPSIFAPGSLFGLVGQSNITWQFIPCSTQGVDGSFAIYGQYSSTSAIAPQVTVSGSTAYNYLTTTLALTTGTRGTAPGPGIRVVGAQHIFSVADGNLTTQFVTQGNLQVNLSDGPAAGVAMTSTGANSASWVSRVIASNPNGAGGKSWIRSTLYRGFRH